MPYKTVSLGKDVWPRRGFMDMPHWMRDVVGQAIKQLPKDMKVEKGTTPPEVQKVYLEKLHQWREGGALLNPGLVNDLTGLQLERASRLFTIDDIHVDLSTKQLVKVDVRERVWRWSHYHFACAYYWALLFHVQNCYLAHPDLIWSEILSSVNTINQGGNIRLYTEGWHAMLLALYERTLGLEYDIANLTPHYVDNVVQRQDLSADEQQKRKSLFTAAVNSLKLKIEEGLRTNQNRKLIRK
jgi:hypothetical protein